jgi:HAD superfamily hydrolase (TIGR01450 family)
MRLVFVTNNASRGANEVANHLTEVGIPSQESDVFTAAQAAAEILVAKVTHGAKVLVIGGEGLRAVVREKGFDVVDAVADRPDAVVQGWHPDVGWRQLAEAAYAVRAGAYFLATNRDLTLPNDRGIAPGNGSLVRAVVTASGVEPECAGKPEPQMFRIAATRAGASLPLVIGDRLDTDIRGANAAGFASLLVFTGASTATDLLHAVPDERPTHIGVDIASLGLSHVAPQYSDGWWCSGVSRARTHNGTLEMNGLRGIDAVRAACAATWQAADRGEATHIESVFELGLE